MKTGVPVADCCLAFIEMTKAINDGDLCFHCKTTIGEDDDTLKCNECHLSYHLGTCAGVTETALRGKKPGFVETWKCQTCRGAKPKIRSNAGDKLSKEDKQGKESQDVQSQLAHIMSMLTVLAPLKVQVDELVTMKDTVMQIEKSVQNMSDQYDEVLKKMKEHDSEIKILKKRVNELENEQKNDETAQLKRELNKLEQYGRANNLEVHGLVKTLNENLLDKLNEIADRIEVPKLTRDSVEAVHRLPAKSNKTPVVIVRFINRNERNVWLENKQKLRTGAGAENVYLQENMTASNRKLFYDARTKAKNLGYKFAWHKEGLSYVRKKEGDPSIRIEHDDDLVKIE